VRSPHRLFGHCRLRGGRQRRVRRRAGSAGDPPTLAAARLRLLGDAELRCRMSMAGLCRAAEFDWTLVTQQVEAYYLAVLARAVAARNHGLRRPSEQSRLAVA
jgi:hypothetical protein